MLEAHESRPTFAVKRYLTVVVLMAAALLTLEAWRSQHVLPPHHGQKATGRPELSLRRLATQVPEFGCDAPEMCWANGDTGAYCELFRNLTDGLMHGQCFCTPPWYKPNAANTECELDCCPTCQIKCCTSSSQCQQYDPGATCEDHKCVCSSGYDGEFCEPASRCVGHSGQMVDWWLAFKVAGRPAFSYADSTSPNVSTLPLQHPSLLPSLRLTAATWLANVSSYAVFTNGYSPTVAQPQPASFASLQDSWPACGHCAKGVLSWQPASSATHPPATLLLHSDATFPPRTAAGGMASPGNDSSSSPEWDWAGNTAAPQAMPLVYMCVNSTGKLGSVAATLGTANPFIDMLRVFNPIPDAITALLTPAPASGTGVQLQVSQLSLQQCLASWPPYNGSTCAVSSPLTSDTSLLGITASARHPLCLQYQGNGGAVDITAAWTPRAQPSTIAAVTGQGVPAGLLCVGDWLFREVPRPGMATSGLASTSPGLAMCVKHLGLWTAVLDSAQAFVEANCEEWHTGPGSTVEMPGRDGRGGRGGGGGGAGGAGGGRGGAGRPRRGRAKATRRGGHRAGDVEVASRRCQATVVMSPLLTDGDPPIPTVELQLTGEGETQLCLQLADGRLIWNYRPPQLELSDRGVELSDARHAAALPTMAAGDECQAAGAVADAMAEFDVRPGVATRAMRREAFASIVAAYTGWRRPDAPGRGAACAAGAGDDVAEAAGEELGDDMHDGELAGATGAGMGAGGGSAATCTSPDSGDESDDDSHDTRRDTRKRGRREVPPIHTIAYEAYPTLHSVQLIDVSATPCNLEADEEACSGWAGSVRESGDSWFSQVERTLAALQAGADDVDIVAEEGCPLLDLMEDLTTFGNGEAAPASEEPVPDVPLDDCTTGDYVAGDCTALATEAASFHGNFMKLCLRAPAHAEDVPTCSTSGANIVSIYRPKSHASVFSSYFVARAGDTGLARAGSWSQNAAPGVAGPAEYSSLPPAVPCPKGKSGADIGHFAPSALFNENHVMMTQTFVYANAAPQHKTANRGQWAKGERAVRKLAAAVVGNLRAATGVSIPATHYNYAFGSDAERAAAATAGQTLFPKVRCGGWATEAPYNGVPWPTMFWTVVVFKEPAGGGGGAGGAGPTKCAALWLENPYPVIAGTARRNIVSARPGGRRLELHHGSVAGLVAALDPGSSVTFPKWVAEDCPDGSAALTRYLA